MGRGKTTVDIACPPPRRHFVAATRRSRKRPGMKIDDIFATHGEADFRAGEARVIARLLKDHGIECWAPAAAPLSTAGRGR